jgi:hypothetical protein
LRAVLTGFKSALFFDSLVTKLSEVLRFKTTSLRPPSRRSHER